MAHGGAGHHAAQGGGDDGHFGGAAGGGTGHGIGQVDEELGDASATINVRSNCPVLAALIRK